MGKKTPIEELIKMFKESDCKLILTDYNCKKPLEYMCSCGSPNIHTITLNSFKAGCRNFDGDRDQGNHRYGGFPESERSEMCR